MKQNYFSVLFVFMLSLFCGTTHAQSSTEEVCIKATEQVIEVDDNPVMFYDDGGKAANVSPNVGGTVVFVPKATGKIVSIDFQKLDLAPGTMYRHQIKVYNGRTADPAQLLTTLMTTQTKVVRSSAADGALTVVFENNSSYTNRAGFEATVSAIAPQAMTFAEVITEQFTTGTASAGDKTQPILMFNVKTAGFSPAIALEKVAFTTNNTHAQLTKATLYFSKTDNTFANATKVGEATITDNVVEITLTQPLALFEGDNYFRLAYDLSDMAEEGATIDATLNTLIISGNTTVVANGNPDGARMVHNLILFEKGTTERTINGSVEFKTKPNPYYSSKHEGDTNDRMITFLPIHEGHKMQINFKAFDLYYSSNASYGVRAEFAVYSGKGKTGELLWKVASTEDAAKGPERVLRSTSADGALTIVFNPKSEASYYIGKGFEAIVSEYQSKAMEFKTVQATQLSTDILSRGDKAQELISFNVKTTGDLSALSFNAVGINLKGSANEIERLTLLSSGANDTATGAVEIATINNPSSDNPLVVNFPKAVILREGDNFFRLLVDLKSTATIGAEIDAAIESITMGSNTQTITTADPEGTRTVKSIVVMKKGDNGEKNIEDGSAMMFYDDGGATAAESKSFSGTITFAPVTSGKAVRLTFKEWKLARTDKFYIYYGGEVKTKEDVLISSSSTLPESVLSKATDGKLTIKYTTGSYAVSDGFAIEVTTDQLKPLAITEVTTTAVTPQHTLKGQTNLPMLKIAVKVEGDIMPVEITDFAANLSGNAAVTRAAVYVTDTNDAFATNNLFASTTSAPFTFHGSYSVAKAGTYYFWLAYDIAPSAVADQTATAQLISVNANNVAHTPSGETATTTIKKGFSGTLTVGANETYTTIQSAIDAISTGIEGATTIRIQPGTYKEHVKVPEIPGMSAVNTLTIESTTNRPTDVKITNDNYQDGGYSDDKMAKEYGVFTFDGADYTTLRGVEITTEKMDYPSVVHLRNKSQNVTVDNCYIHAPYTESAQQDINLVNMYAANVANANNDFFTLQNSRLEGGYIGVRLGGTGNVSLPKEVGGRIRNNAFTGQGTKAIYVARENDAEIIGNTIENTVSTKADFNAIDLWTNRSAKIEGNRISLSTSNYATAIYIRSIEAPTDKPATIVNNAVFVSTEAMSSSAIKFNKASTNLTIAHNTFVMAGKNTPTAVWFNDNMGENVVFTQNIVQNNAGGYVYNLYKTANVSTIRFSRNNLYTTGTLFTPSKINARNFDEWKTLSGETDSYNETVEFVSDAVLEPSAEGNLRKTEPLAIVTTDIEDRQRDAAHPTMGAYEYMTMLPAPVMATDYPMATNLTDASAVIRIKANASGRAYVLVRKQSEVVPTADDVFTAGKAVAIVKDQETSHTATELTKDEPHVAYVLLENIRETRATTVQSVAFIPSSAPIIVPPTPPVLTVTDKTITAGSAANLSVEIADGKAPYDIQWMNGKREIVATDVVPIENDDYTVTVTDANGAKATATCRVLLTGKAVTATFENLYLAPESYWYSPEVQGSFVSGTYRFDSGSYAEWNTWYNFGYANQTATNYETFTDKQQQFRNAIGAGYDGSENFAVYYAQGGKVHVTNNAEGDILRGFYITNAAWTLKAMKEGDGMSTEAGGFKKGDYLKLTIRGEKADGTQASLDYYLADYRASNVADHYMIDTWQWVDLRALGKVKNITFRFEGTKKNNYGLTTPTYFCMDNFNGERQIVDLAEQVVAETLDLKTLLAGDGSAATCFYALADEVNAAVKANITLDTDGLLTIKGTEKEQFSLIIRMTQAGKTQFVRLPINFLTKTANTIETIDQSNSIRIEAGQLIINGATKDAEIELFTPAGIRLTAGKGSAITLPNTAQRVFIVKITENGKERTATVKR